MGRGKLYHLLLGLLGPLSTSSKINHFEKTIEISGPFDPKSGILRGREMRRYDPKRLKFNRANR